MSVVDILDNELRKTQTYKPKERKCVYPLDLNENLVIPKELLQEIIIEAAKEIDPRTYPAKERREAEEALARVHNVDPEQIVLFNGADDAIDTLINLAGQANPGKATVLALKPSFTIYRTRTLVKGLNYIESKIDRDTLKPDLRDLAEKASVSELVFFDIPNNPTGIIPLDRVEIEEIIEKTRGIVAIDEVYAQYIAEGWESVDLVKRYDNAATIRSFSKSYGLAGMRIGYIIASGRLASILKRSTLPFHINKLALRLIVKVLERNDIFKKYIDEVIDLRDYMYRKLTEINPLKVYRSYTNFLLLDAGKHHSEILKKAHENGYCIREFKGVFDENDKYIRITVPPNRETADSLIDVIKQAVG